jgi:excisionase family DNA binding protein
MEGTMPANSNGRKPRSLGNAVEEPIPDAESDFEPLLDVTEAAKLLRIHPKTLRTKARHGEIPAKQIGKLWRFRASALNEWLDSIAS